MKLIIKKSECKSNLIAEGEQQRITKNTNEEIPVKPYHSSFTPNDEITLIISYFADDYAIKKIMGDQVARIKTNEALELPLTVPFFYN